MVKPKSVFSFFFIGVVVVLEACSIADLTSLSQEVGGDAGVINRTEITRSSPFRFPSTATAIVFSMAEDLSKKSTSKKSTSKKSAPKKSDSNDIDDDLTVVMAECLTSAMEKHFASVKTRFVKEDPRVNPGMANDYGGSVGMYAQWLEGKAPNDFTIKVTLFSPVSKNIYSIDIISFHKANNTQFQPDTSSAAIHEAMAAYAETLAPI
ncbi:hypothetical protein [Marinibactrum halimedae]|uniref:Uncharacterized protein n=1 Tax=Marinibactrum halimedae TaxID=1444977 RepID=A0AA37T740_9GAMM|nr:hypothetical protein [Marinibactrum halimedae]MCD9459470.1 hypothetical protein [Marinibactrum halimedae]GLS28124.1 hypothetical protein GCM10007877_38430 [Marinibactrum halimedae]